MSDAPLASLSDFDFWIGAWHLRWSDQSHERRGRDVISKVLSDRVTWETVWAASCRRAAGA